ncbi:hypothetical protein RQP46_003676 [Phenoliferia psychrophenolica]
MSHLAPSLSSLPMELKCLIARMARDQDRIYLMPQWENLPNAPEELAFREKLSRRDRRGGTLYGASLSHLAAVSRDWRDATREFRNETINTRSLSVAALHRTKLERDDVPLAPDELERLLTFDRIKHRVRRVTFRNRPSACSRSELRLVMNEMVQLPNVVEVSLDRDCFVEGYRRPEDGEPGRWNMFSDALEAYPGVGRRITSFTFAFGPNGQDDGDEQWAPGDGRVVLARLIAGLPNLVHLGVINPIYVFSSSDDDEGLRTALEGAQHLTSLSLRLAPDYVDVDREGQEPCEIWMKEEWLSWKPSLKVLDIRTKVLDKHLTAFIAGVAPTLERLSLSYDKLLAEQNVTTGDADPFLPSTSFPALSHLRLCGNSRANDFILESLIGSPISHLHLLLTQHSKPTLLTTPSNLDRYLPSLRTLRVDYVPTRPIFGCEDLRERCEEKGVAFNMGTTTAISRLKNKHGRNVDSALEPYTSCKSSQLLSRAQDLVKRHTAEVDSAGAAELEKALDGLRVLLKMHDE